MKVLVTGASGTVGKAVCEFFAKSGHDVVTLVRRKTRSEHEIRWSPNKGYIDTEALEAQRVDAVIHLAGESIVGLWVGDKKNKIEDSRIQGTELLSEALASLEHKPKVFVSASAIGYYGNRGDEAMTEMSAPAGAIERQSRQRPFMLLDSEWGVDYLSKVTMRWERATAPASAAGIRTVVARLGIVLSPKGGVLKHAGLPFKLGVAGPFGNGKQYMSWVAMDDVVGALHHFVTDETIKGPVNVVSPKPVTNKEFTASFSRRAFVLPFLGSAANWIPVPSLVLRMFAGEMGNALFLSSTRVEPLRLAETGYKFQYPELDDALKHLIG